MNELIRDDDSRDDGDAIEDASYLTERVTTVSYPPPFIKFPRAYRYTWLTVRNNWTFVKVTVAKISRRSFHNFSEDVDQFLLVKRFFDSRHEITRLNHCIFFFGRVKNNGEGKSGTGMFLIQSRLRTRCLCEIYKSKDERYAQIEVILSRITTNIVISIS